MQASPDLLPTASEHRLLPLGVLLENIEAMFRAFYDAAGGEPPSQEDFNRLAPEHGQEFVGPPL